MKRRVNDVNVRLNFLPAAFLSLVVLFACAGGRAHAQGTASGELPRKGFAGVQVGPVPEEVRARLRLTAGQGLLVGRVVAGSAAAEAGLAEGDVLLEAAG